MKDEALTPVAFLLETLPIAQPTDEIRARIEAAAGELIAMAQQQQDGRRAFLDWLGVEFEIDKPSQKLQAPANLDENAFLAEVKKLRGKNTPLTVVGLKSLRQLALGERAGLSNVSSHQTS